MEKSLGSQFLSGRFPHAPILPLAPAFFFAPFAAFQPWATARATYVAQRGGAWAVRPLIPSSTWQAPIRSLEHVFLLGSSVAFQAWAADRTTYAARTSPPSVRASEGTLGIQASQGISTRLKAHMAR